MLTVDVYGMTIWENPIRQSLPYKLSPKKEFTFLSKVKVSKKDFEARHQSRAWEILEYNYVGICDGFHKYKVKILTHWEQ